PPRVRRSPAAALVELAGRPLRGVTGELARDNVRRNPRRALNTATALAVGVAVGTLATVFITSLKASAQDSVRASFAGDLAVTPSGFGPRGTFEPALAGRIAALPQVAGAVGLGQGEARVGDDDVTLGIADPRALARVGDLGGQPIAGLTTGELAV